MTTETTNTQADTHDAEYHDWELVARYGGGDDIIISVWVARDERGYLYRSEAIYQDSGRCQQRGPARITVAEYRGHRGPLRRIDAPLPLIREHVARRIDTSRWWTEIRIAP